MDYCWCFHYFAFLEEKTRGLAEKSEVVKSEVVESEKQGRLVPCRVLWHKNSWIPGSRV